MTAQTMQVRRPDRSTRFASPFEFLILFEFGTTFLYQKYSCGVNSLLTTFWSPCLWRKERLDRTKNWIRDEQSTRRNEDRLSRWLHGIIILIRLNKCVAHSPIHGDWPALALKTQRKKRNGKSAGQSSKFGAAGRSHDESHEPGQAGTKHMNKIKTEIEYNLKVTRVHKRSRGADWPLPSGSQKGSEVVLTRVISGTGMVRTVFRFLFCFFLNYPIHP